MKKIISLIFVSLLLVSPLVMAQTIEQEAGITPDSALWGLEIAMEKIMMMFIFQQQDKINFGLQIANERLAEIQIMIEQNKLQFMNRAEVERNRIIDEVEINAEGLSEERKEFVRERLQTHVQVLEGVKETAPKQAQMGLQTAIKKSSQVLERFKLNSN